MAKSRKETMQEYHAKRKKQGFTQIKFEAPQEFKDKLMAYKEKRGFKSLYDAVKYLLRVGGG
jgi:hypothetical protein